MNKDFYEQGLKIMEKTREILKTEDQWCKQFDGSDSTGKLMSPYDERACKFCLNGAILKSNYELNGQYYSSWSIISIGLREVLCTILDQNLWEGGLTDYNDLPERTFEEISVFIDATINLLKEKINE